MNNRKNKLLIVLILVTIVFIFIVGCENKEEEVLSKETLEQGENKDKDDDVDKVEGLKEIVVESTRKIEEKVGNDFEEFYLTIKEREDLREDLREDGSISSVSYKEEWYGVKSVDTTYYSDEDDRKIIAILLKFPDNYNIEKIKGEIEKDLGEPSTEEVIDEDHIYEWIKDNEAVYRLEEVDDSLQLLVTYLN